MIKIFDIGIMLVGFNNKDRSIELYATQISTPPLRYPTSTFQHVFFLDVRQHPPVLFFGRRRKKISLTTILRIPGDPSDQFITHRIHGAGKYTYSWLMFMGSMYLNIPAPWILRVMVGLVMTGQAKKGLKIAGLR